MSWFDSLWRYLTEEHPIRSGNATEDTDKRLKPSRDELTAINTLARTIGRNRESVETLLALGNLFRSQADIERAVKLREAIIDRPGIQPEFQAWAWFELGRDFRKAGFLERSMQAFEKARAISGDNVAILREMAGIAADGGDYKLAADIHGRLGEHRAEAHYLVRLGQHTEAEDSRTSGDKHIAKALRVYPGSPEAWLETIGRDFRAADWFRLNEDLGQALTCVPRHLQFIILEGLLQMASGCQPDDPFCALPVGSAPPEAKPGDDPFLDAILDVLTSQPPDLLNTYYGSWILLCRGRAAQAAIWLEKTLILDPDFWPARLELLNLSMHGQEMPPVFKIQLEYFVDRARRVKRFVCSQCGLKRMHLFFTCPRCRSWHSIAFRKSLND